MLRVTILCMGKNKEAYWDAACREYVKRLGVLCKLQLLELPAAPLPQKPAPQSIAAALEAEGKTLLERLPAQCRLYAACVEGKLFSSEEFSADLNYAALMGEGHVAFAVGSSYGLAPCVKERSAVQLSFSRMTFPHQLARVLLLEQLYRALQIQNGGKYHK